jgi:glutamate-1-semialdehyde 2,1-aminomutase
VLRDARTLHAGTYNGNPVCLAAASAVLEILAEPGVFERMHAHGNSLRSTIAAEAARIGQPLVTSGTGVVFGIHWGASARPRNYREWLNVDMPAYQRFRARIIERGIYLLPDGRWYVGAAHDRAALEEAMSAIRSSMAEG